MKNTFNLYQYQQETIDWMINIRENNTYNACGGILNLEMGCGKCHAINTKIMMYDGTIKYVQDIKVGDMLMGDDSTPRNVLSIASGKDDMYDIIPIKGEKYNVTKDHILCLQISFSPTLKYKDNGFLITWVEDLKYKTKNFKKEVDAIEFLNNVKQDEIIEITVEDYVKLPKRAKKDLLKGYKVPVSFPEIELPLDPYMIGFWLGDGSSNGPEITNQDSTVLKYFRDNLHKYNCYLQYKSKYSYRINENGSGNVGCNYFLNTLTDLDLIKNKHIPHMYKCNSRENRLKLLAGLIDSDGSLDRGRFEFSQKNEVLIDNVIYLARSLGFGCYKKKKQTSWTYKDGKKNSFAYVISITGEGIEDIPTLCPRKQASPRQQIKNVLRSGIKAVYTGVDNYYGFMIDGNRRFLLGDFTVTHNTILSLEYIMQDKKEIDNITKLDNNTNLIICSKTLINEWINQIEKFYNEGDIKYLILHKDNKDIKKYTIDQFLEYDILFATYTSILFIDKSLSFSDCYFTIDKSENNRNWIKKNTAKLYTPNGKTGCNLLYSIKYKNIICDEVHNISNYKTGTFKGIYALPSQYKFGLTGTPAKSDKSNIIALLKFLNADELEYPYFWNKKFVINVEYYNLIKSITCKDANIVLPEIKFIIKKIKFNAKLKEIYNKYIEFIGEVVNEDPDDVKYMVLLGLFTRLRQICISSKLLTNNDESISQYKKISKKSDTKEIVEFNNHKYAEIIKLTNEIKDKNEKVIIFSSFTSYLELVHDEMNVSKDISTIILSTDSQQERKQKLDNWRTNKNNFVLLLNFKTGAEGLNLTEANNIILCDTWWIHSVENQAISRAYRNGQEKVVNVFRLVMKNSIEEIIYTKSQLKKNLFEKFKNNEEIEEVNINTSVLISMLNEV